MWIYVQFSVQIDVLATQACHLVDVPIDVQHSFGREAHMDLFKTNTTQTPVSSLRSVRCGTVYFVFPATITFIFII